MIFTKDKSFYKTLLILAIPIALQNLITFSVGLCDNVMIGTLGDDAVSGVYMGGQIQTLLQIFSGGIEGAILVLSAQYWGVGDRESIRKIVSIGIRFSFFFGVAITALCAIFPKWVISLFTPQSNVIESGAEYLSIVCYSFILFLITQSLIASMRSVEAAKIGLYVSLVSLAVNFSLNYVLIFGKLGFAPLGIKGAAIATVVARICELLLTLVYVFVFDKKLELKFTDILKIDRMLLCDFLKYGTPIILGQLVWATNMLSSSAIMGRQSADGVIAGLSIANTLSSLTYVVMNGMSGAVGIITGKTIGMGKEQKMREYAKTVQVLFLILGICSGAFLFLIKDPFISIYGVSNAARNEARRFINVMSVTTVGTCYQAACLFGLVKSGGDIGFVFKNDLFFVFLIVIPSALIATKLSLPAWVVFACLKSDQILKCFVAAVKINRFNWMKNLTRDKSVSTER